ncbi:MAG: hypothetical protein MZW92_38880 [Comamonadaceae bacterium]|nr:hypothetical protein [Comamonadaceae bacterium]
MTDVGPLAQIDAVRHRRAAPRRGRASTRANCWPDSASMRHAIDAGARRRASSRRQTDDRAPPPAADAPRGGRVLRRRRAAATLRTTCR